MVELACGADDLETLCSSIQAAGLEEALSGGEWTVFAPTNESFDALPEDALAATLEDVEELTDLLLYHVVPDQILRSSDLPCDAGDNVNEMGNVKDTRTRCIGGVPTYQKGIANPTDNMHKFVVVDVEAYNGIIHIIDGVLLDNSFL